MKIIAGRLYLGNTGTVVKATGQYNREADCFSGEVVITSNLYKNLGVKNDSWNIITFSLLPENTRVFNGKLVEVEVLSFDQLIKQSKKRAFIDGKFVSHWDKIFI